MATFLISILAALGVVMIIIVLGLILTQILINRADKVQTQDIVVDLPKVEQEASITVISNDIIEGTPHRHRHLMKKTISVIDQDVQVNTENTTTEQIHTYKGLITPTKTDSNMFSSNTSIIDPLTDKITLDY
jgi:hypothetical protein